VVKHVLERLDPTDCALLARVGKLWLAVALANELRRAGKGGAVPLEVEDFVAWLGRRTTGARLPVEREDVCIAARAGRLEVLQWALEYGCPWNPLTFAHAARGGHPYVLRWAREHGCPWDRRSIDSPNGVDARRQSNMCWLMGVHKYTKNTTASTNPHTKTTTTKNLSSSHHSECE